MRWYVLWNGLLGWRIVLLTCHQGLLRNISAAVTELCQRKNNTFPEISRPEFDTLTSLSYHSVREVGSIAILLRLTPLSKTNETVLRSCNLLSRQPRRRLRWRNSIRLMFWDPDITRSGNEVWELEKSLGSKEWDSEIIQWIRNDGKGRAGAREGRR